MIDMTMTKLTVPAPGMLQLQPLSMDVLRHEPVQIDIGAMVKQMVEAVEKAVDWVIKNLCQDANDMQIRKWVDSLPTRAWIHEGYAYMIVFDDIKPSRTRILKEPILT